MFYHPLQAQGHNQEFTGEGYHKRGKERTQEPFQTFSFSLVIILSKNFTIMALCCESSIYQHFSGQIKVSSFQEWEGSINMNATWDISKCP